MTSSNSAPPSRSIRVTDHALARARERHADLRSLPEGQLLLTICREVGAALRNERVAKTAPRETIKPGYTRRQKAKWDRYAWNAARSRVYVIRRSAGQQIVVTVLRTTLSQ